jgi:Na+/proline symporter
MLEKNIDKITLENLAKIDDLERTQRQKAKLLIKKADPQQETNDKDYVFISFILGYLPQGIVGLLLAVILSAAMSSTASELNALAATTTVDLYQRNVGEKSPAHLVKASQGFTLLWGGIAILFAAFGSLVENLIQLVNIIGSVFYGTILGVFLVAFFLKQVKGKAVFLSAILSEVLIIFIFTQDWVSFLWLNVIGAVLTVGIALLLQQYFMKK